MSSKKHAVTRDMIWCDGTSLDFSSDGMNYRGICRAYLGVRLPDLDKVFLHVLHGLLQDLQTTKNGRDSS